MRAFNKTYIKSETNIKEASVIRCEQMNEIDEMEYNGTIYPWFKFK